MNSIAIVGAGIAGLTVASMLHEKFAVTVFEKSSSVGGRMSVRRKALYAFDHGAQYFDIKSDKFIKFTLPMIKAGVIQTWDGHFMAFKNGTFLTNTALSNNIKQYVGVPGMNAIAKYLARNININLMSPIKSIDYDGKKWCLKNASGAHFKDYDWVVTAIPPAQALAILPPHLLLNKVISKFKMQGCICLMLGFDDPLSFEFNAVLIHDEDIRLISLNNTKPKRNNITCIVVHSTHEYATKNTDKSKKMLIEDLVKKTTQVLKVDVAQANHKDIHIWRYAGIDAQNTENCIIDFSKKIGICGDWLIGSHVESAFLSGYHLAEKIKGVR